MASVDFIELFRTLSYFQPASARLAAAPWEAYVDWAIAQGLAPLAAYNLEYRLAGAGAPEWARDRLLSVYQGSLNDNVMKLVNFKRAVDELEGRKLLLLGPSSFAEALYPHVAFRPVGEIEILLHPGDVEGFSRFLGTHSFAPPKEGAALPSGVRQLLTDGRTEVLLYAEILGAGRTEEEKGIFERAIPMPVYGPSFYRPDLEDALLLTCLDMARAGFEVPMVAYLDLRELLLGAPSLGGPYSRAVDAAKVLSLAQAWGVERALYAAVSIVGRLFPSVSSVASQLQPKLRGATQRLLERWVIEPASRVGQSRTLRGSERLKRFLVYKRNQ